MDSTSTHNHGEGSSSAARGGRQYQRHTPNQIQLLEAFFEDCRNPEEDQRQQLSWETGLTHKQVKFWFQNKRTQMKTENARAENVALRDENKKLLMENLALRNPLCSNCVTLNSSCEEHLRQENHKLREELLRVKAMLDFGGRPSPGK